MHVEIAFLRYFNLFKWIFQNTNFDLAKQRAPYDITNTENRDKRNKRVLITAFTVLLRLIESRITNAVL